jgi:hypothetical protein
MTDPAPITVIEMPELLSAVRRLMDDDERTALVVFPASNPTAGDLIKGTGGVRKLRWGLQGRGKRGGVRVIYFYHNATLPLLVLTAYAKNVRADLDDADRNDFRELTRLLVKSYGKGKR